MDTPPPATQKIIRYSQIMGPIVFLALVMFLSPDPLDDESQRPLMYAFSAVFLVASGLLLLFLKPRRDAATDPQRIFVVNLIGGALAEGIALFGCVIAFMGGPIYPALVGIVLTAFMLFVYFPVAE